jgi:hypothetical protein
MNLHVSNADFYSAVFHTVDENASVWGTSFKSPPDKSNGSVWRGQKLDYCTVERDDRYSDGTHNTFYCVSSFQEDNDGKFFRRKDNFNATHVITLDDIGDGASAKISWDKIALLPSFVIETSPDNCQVGYILKEPEYDANRVNSVVDALIGQGLASPVDPGMKGVTRYVRFPVGINNKTKYDPSHQHVLKQWHPDRTYSLDDIIKAYRLVFDELPQVSSAHGRSNFVTIDADDDPYLKVLKELNLVLTGELRGDGNKVDIRCPWHGEHTDRVDEGAVYFLGGGFKCFHGHCVDRNFSDVKEKLNADHDIDVNALDHKMREARNEANETDTLRLFSQGCRDLVIPQSSAPLPKNNVDNIPPEILMPPGLAGEIANYHNGVSHRVTPVYGVVAALASMSALAGGQYRVNMPFGPASTNLFILALGGTGSGKEAPRGVVKEILKIAGNSRAELSAASDVALLQKLNVQPNAIWLIDEFGRNLKFAANASGGHQYALISQVMKLYGLALSSTEAREYAQSKNNIPAVNHPYLTVLATSTKNSVTDAMTSEEVVGGTLNRFITIPNSDVAPPFRDAERAVMSAEMKSRIKAFSQTSLISRHFPANGDHSNFGFIDIVPTEEAATALINYRGEADDNRAKADGAGAHLWSRSYENTVRVAGCIAIGDSSAEKPVLTIEHAQWAITFMRWSTQQSLGLLDQIADSETERDSKRIVAFIKECAANPKKKSEFYKLNKAGWVPKSQIARRFRNIKSFDRNHLLNDCVEGRYLEFEDFPSAGKSMTKTGAFRPIDVK